MVARKAAEVPQENCPEYDAASIGARISQLRELRGLSRTQLGALVGTTDSALSQMERGKSGAPRFEVGVRIAAELGVTPWYLLTGEGAAMTTPTPALPGATVAQLVGLIGQVHRLAVEMTRGSVALAEVTDSVAQAPPQSAPHEENKPRHKRAS